MEKVLVNARIDPQIKKKAAAYLAGIGLTISDVIRIAISRTANE